MHQPSANQTNAASSIDARQQQRQIRLLVCLMGFSSLAFFTFMPYLALYLHLQFGLSNTVSGLAVGSITLISACGAWLGGALADRIGWLLSLRGAASGYCVVLAGLAWTQNITLILCLIAGIGLARMLMEPALKTALASYDDGSGRLFKVRYLSVSFGAIVGPLLASGLAQFGARSSFAFGSGFFAVYWLISLCLKSATRAARKQRREDAQHSTVPAGIMWPQVLSLIAFGFAFFIAFSQIESTLSLSLNARFGASGVEVYRYVLFINAALSIPMMLASDKIFAKWTLVAQVSFGVAVLALALFLWFYQLTTPNLIYLGTFFFTLGEVILYPLPEIAAAKLAGEGQRGKILGLIDVRYLGFFIGPALGGFLLDHAPNVLVWVLCGLCLTIYPLFVWSQRLAAQVLGASRK